jgi:hypothetical protein
MGGGGVSKEGGRAWRERREEERVRQKDRQGAE